MREDFLSQAVNQLAGGPGIWILLIGAAIGTLLGLVLLMGGRTYRPGLIVTAVSVLLFWLGLSAMQFAEVKTDVSPQITVTRQMYSLGTRQIVLYAMVLIPILAAAGALTAWRVETRRRRAMLPTYVKNGLRAFFQSDYDTALKEFGTAIAIDPSRAETFNRRGEVYLQMGQLDAALNDFNRATELAPELAAAYRLRGMVYARREESDLAMTDFDFALRLDPTDCSALLQRGLCLSKMGQTERATFELRRVLHLTNHSDYVDPARAELQRLGAID